MTAIAYRDGLLAADSLTAVDGTIIPAGPKLHRMVGAWVGAAGRSDDVAVFLRWFGSGRGEGAWRQPLGDLVALAMWDDGGLSLYAEQPVPEEIPAVPYFAVGAGHEVALAGLTLGLSSPEAVALACRLRTDCGAPVALARRGGTLLAEHRPAG